MLKQSQLCGLKSCCNLLILQCQSSRNIRRLLLAFILLFATVVLANNNYAADIVADLTNKGREAFSNKQFDRAIECFSKVIEIDPQNANAYYVRGWAHEWKADHDMAIMDFSQSVELSTNSYSLSYAYMSRGDVYLAKSNFTNAMADLSAALKLNPGLAEAYVGRAYINYLLTNSDDTIADCNAALKLDDKSWRAYLYRGVAFVRKDNLSDGIKDFDKAVQIDPNNAEAFLYRGICYSKTGNYTNALRDFDHAFSLEPQNGLLLANRGFARFKLAEYEAGLEDLKGAIQICTNCFEAYNDLAWVLCVSPDIHVRNGALALKYAKTACEAAEYNNSSYLGTLAAAFAEVGDFGNAVKWQEKAIQLGVPATDLAEAKERLKLYENKMPYHIALKP